MSIDTAGNVVTILDVIDEEAQRREDLFKLASVTGAGVLALYPQMSKAELELSIGAQHPEIGETAVMLAVSDLIPA